MKLLILISVIAFSFNSYCQSGGYFGKKNTVAVDGLASMPLIALIFKVPQGYKNSNGTLVESRDLFDYGYRISTSHTFSSKFGLGLEYGLDYSNLKTPKSIRFQGEYDDIGSEKFQQEMLDMRTNSVMLIMDYYLGNWGASPGDYYAEESLFPLGFSNQIGVGYSWTKLVNRDYLYSIDESVANEVGKDIFSYSSDQSVWDITVTYRLSFRQPISKNFLINYSMVTNVSARGIGNFADFMEGTSGRISYSEGASIYDDRYIETQVLRRRLVSLIYFKMGLSYVF